MKNTRTLLLSAAIAIICATTATYAGPGQGGVVGPNCLHLSENVNFPRL